MALLGRDMIGISATGSGKTLAFLLPAMIHINAQVYVRRVISRHRIRWSYLHTQEAETRTWQGYSSSLISQTRAKWRNGHEKPFNISCRCFTKSRVCLYEWYYYSLQSSFVRSPSPPDQTETENCDSYFLCGIIQPLVAALSSQKRNMLRAVGGVEN